MLVLVWSRESDSITEFNRKRTRQVRDQSRAPPCGTHLWLVSICSYWWMFFRVFQIVFVCLLGTARLQCTSQALLYCSSWRSRRGTLSGTQQEINVIWRKQITCVSVRTNGPDASKWWCRNCPYIFMFLHSSVETLWVWNAHRLLRRMFLSNGCDDWHFKQRTADVCGSFMCHNALCKFNKHYDGDWAEGFVWTVCVCVCVSPAQCSVALNSQRTDLVWKYPGGIACPKMWYFRQ